VKKKINKKLLFLFALSFAILFGLAAGRVLSSPYSWDDEFQNSYPIKEFVSVERGIEICAKSNSPECDKVMEEIPLRVRDAEIYHSGYMFCIEKFGKSSEECGKLLNEVHLNEDFSQHLPSRTN
jgi:hypothetical protein